MIPAYVIQERNERERKRNERQPEERVHIQSDEAEAYAKWLREQEKAIKDRRGSRIQIL